MTSPRTSDRCVGVLLAGGAARRFGGQPKGLATIGGRRIADNALDALRAATSEQIVVANDPAAPGWFPEERVIADDAPGLGPLGGITTALAAAHGAGIVVVAWDMPFLSGALLAELRRRGGGEVDAVLPRHRSGVEPLCAWYGPSALRTCRTLLAAGERRASALAERSANVEWLEGTALEAFGDPERLFMSVDTPEKLATLGGAHP